MNVRFEGNNGQDADVTRWLLMTLADVRELQNAFGILKSAQKAVAKRQFGGNLSSPRAIKCSGTSQPGGRACSDFSLSPSLKEMSNGTGHFDFFHETTHGRRAGAECYLDSFGGGG